MDARVTEFAASEAKARFSELLDRAEAGEDITIRRHGKRVARISAFPSELPSAEEQMRTWDEWFAYRNAKNISLGPNATIMDLFSDTRGE